MKIKHLAIFPLLFLFISVSEGQILSTGNYNVSFYNNDSAIYNLTGSTTVLRANATDTVTGLYPIGFNFYYMGRLYDSLSVGSGGFAVLGAVPVSLSNNFLNNDSAAYSILALYWDNLFAGADGGVFMQTLGTAPNRVCVIQWEVTGLPGTSGTYLSLIQAVLHEHSNRIDFDYTSRPGYGLQGIGVPTTSLTGESTGIKTMFNNHSEYLDCSINNFFAYSTAYYDVYGNATNYESYYNYSAITFYADSSNCAAPITFSSISYPTQIDLRWVDNSTSEDIFRIYRSTDSIHYIEIQTVVSTTKTTTGQAYTYQDTDGIQPGIRYYYHIVASALGGQPSPALIGSAAPPVPLLSGLKRIPGDYNTITAAMQDIHMKYLAGPITLELEQNYNSALEVYPITIDGHYYNPSLVNSITIHPAANVTTPLIIRDTLAGYPVIMQNTTSIYVNGAPGGVGSSRMLYVNSLNGGYASFLLNSQTSNIYLSNLKLNGVYLSSSNTSIKGCELTGLLSFDGVIQNLTIDSNFFHDFGANAISNTAYYYVGNNIAIRNNSFYHFHNATGVISITDSYGGNHYAISGNYIGGNAPGAVGMDSIYINTTGINITLSFGAQAQISNNVIRGFQSYPNYFSGVTAIDATTGDFLIENNLIGDTVNYSLICGGGCKGIYLNQGNGTQIARGNTISGIQANTAYGIYSRANGGSNSTIYGGPAMAIIENNTIGAKSQPRSILGGNGIYATNNGKTIIKGNSINNVNSGIFSESERQEVIGNKINHVSGGGIYVNTVAYSPDTIDMPAVVESNTVTDGGGISVGGAGFVNANKVYSYLNYDTASPQTGIALGRGTGGFFENILCTNNFVCLGYDTNGHVLRSTAQIKGIESNGANIKILNNSIYVTGDSSTFYGFSQAYGLNIDSSIAKNNIVQNAALFHSQTLSDYGAFFAGQAGPSHDWIYCTGNNVIPCWPVGADTGAVYGVNPMFKHAYGTTDSIDLHLLPGSAAAAAVPALSLVPTDIDGNLRPTGSNITIGAHELNPAGTRENSPPVITYTPLRDTVAATIILPARISDSTLVMGASSPYPPYMYFKTKSAIGWSQNIGSLSSGNYQNGNWNFPFPSSFIQSLAIGDTVQYFVTAEDIWHNLATNAAGGKGFNTAFIDTFPANPDFFVYTNQAHSPHVFYAPLLSGYINSTYTLNVNVTDSQNMNLSGDTNLICYYKRNSTGNFYKSSGAFQNGSTTNNNWSINLNVSGMAGISANDTVYYFVVAQDNNSVNNLGSLPVGVIGPRISHLTTYPSHLYFFTIVPSPTVHTPFVNYTPLQNGYINGNYSLNINVTDSQAMNLNGDTNVLCYYKRNSTGSFYKASGAFQNGSATNNNWIVSLNVPGISGISVNDTVYYFVAAQDNNNVNTLGSLPIGAIGQRVSNLAAYPSHLYFFTILPSPSVHTPIVNYTPLQNGYINSNYSLNINVTDSQTMNLNGDTNVLCYYKRTAIGTYYKAWGNFTNGTTTNNNWSVQLNIAGITGITYYDTIYYFIVAQDNNNPDHLGSLPIGAQGPDISHLTSFPALPDYFIILRPSGINEDDSKSETWLLAYDRAMNPFIMVDRPNMGMEEYRIINSLGQEMKTGPIDQNRISIGNGLAPGIYFISIIGNGSNQLQTKKFAVINN